MSFGYVWRDKGADLTRVFEIPHIQNALEHVIELALLTEIQTRDETLTQAAISSGLAGQVHVLGIGRQDGIFRFREGSMNGSEGIVPCRGRERGKDVGCRLCVLSRIGRGCVGERHDDCL